MKDYYKILGLTPSANLQDIKNAYRKLAHQYHPDKNPSNSYAEAQFQLIKEAYTTLITPELKEAYLQERWLHKTMGRGMEAPAVTPPQLLNKVLAAHRAFLKMDAYRVDKKGIFRELAGLINEEKIELLNRFDEEAINNEIIKWMTESIFLIRYRDQLIVLDQLKKIQAGSSAQLLICQKQKEIRQAILWARAQPVLLLLIIILLCIIIARSL
ncbi:molecular chaperone DnaJ [Niabella ginsenosidivorans]|uniref:Molecular chaperone DnaJ n=1 Tax=Niabella ginsenosidivorans TaxID=1176587 RepID=A0A1A9I1W5_9BACT|nr:DnaJ domain-containing protein [Niabella ginsenosidivorans]ANH80682.1 molecular chaperone DnaJ [Niabella ginsenosidivorans]